MIDPVIFTFKLFNWPVTVTWYGVIVMLGVLIGAWFAEREVRRRGENSEVMIDAMVWAVIIGILGARLWFVANSALGGNTSYFEDPWSIIRPPIQGLHFFGGLLFGGLAMVFFMKRNGHDVWLFLDSVAPAVLIGQAFGRLGNYINQELYGPPTDLPWGIPIEASHRLPQFPVSLFPEETTRFHPTFAYEMILNILIVLFLYWLSRRYERELKPGAIFSAWLLLAGLSRTFIEFFRPDQARIGETFISYTMVVSFLMAVSGALMLLVRFGKLRLAMAEGWEETYQIQKPARSPRAPGTPLPEARPASPARKAPAAKSTAPPKKKKTPSRKTTPGKRPAKTRR
jgi:phosphatidylglycerol:prolipoprotein diacylglycerol transferase